MRELEIIFNMLVIANLVSGLSQISTVLGTGSVAFTSDNIRATSASISSPYGVWGDSNNNLYVTESGGARIRRVDFITQMTTTFGGTGTESIGSASVDNLIGDGGKATSASFSTPDQITGDTNGLNLYLSDRTNQRVRLITLSTNIISTITGNGQSSSTGSGGQASSATVSYPSGLFFDTSGQLYVGESGGNLINKIDLSGVITRIAGTGTISTSGVLAGDGGRATSAMLSSPYQLYMFGTEQILYFSDTGNNKVRTVNLNTQSVDYIAGTGSAGTTTSESGAATSIPITPTGFRGDSTGRIYISEYFGNKIRQIDTTNIMSTLVGLPQSPGTPTATLGDGGAPTAATLYNPFGLFVDTVGSLYCADISNNKIRYVYDYSPTTSPTHIPTIAPTYYSSSFTQITTVVGSGDTADTSSIPNLRATSASILGPRSVWSDSVGVLNVMETGRSRLQKVDLNSIISCIAGTGSASGATDSVNNNIGDNGQATSATFQSDAEQTFGDTVSHLFIADVSNQRVRKVNLISGIISTAAGTGSAVFGGDGGRATSATLYLPTGVWRHSNGFIYILENGGLVVRCVDNGNTITTIAGTGSESLTGTSVAEQIGDGGAATSATFSGPRQISGDTVNHLYVADGNNNKIRKINTITNTITLVAGTGSASTNTITTSAATSVDLRTPFGVSSDLAGRVLISEYAGNKVSVVSTSGILTRIAGTGAGGSTPRSLNGDSGAPTSAVFSSLFMMFVDSVDAVYLSDYLNCKIRKIYDASLTTAPSVSPTTAPSASPSMPPSRSPSTQPSVVPTSAPSKVPSVLPTVPPTIQPTTAPSVAPTATQPTVTPTVQPSISRTPSAAPYYTSSYTQIQTVIGVGTASYNGDNIKATAATLNSPLSTWSDTQGVVYVSDQTNQRIRKVDTDSIIQTIAGTGATSANILSVLGDGVRGTSASFNYPQQIFGTTSGALYLADNNNCRIRMMSLTSTIISLVAGNGAVSSQGDGGYATSASVWYPVGVWADTLNTIYLSEYAGQKIRKIDNNNIISTICGTGTASSPGVPGFNVQVLGDGGRATSALLNSPRQLFGDSVNLLYFADWGNQRVRVVNLNTNIVNYIAGTGTYGIATSAGLRVAATSTTLANPQGVCSDVTGNVFISENDGQKVSQINSAGVMRRIAGVAGSASTSTVGVNGDGAAPTSALLKGPNMLFVDTAAVLFISDQGNNRIRTVLDFVPSARPSAAPSYYRSSFTQISTIGGTGGMTYNGGTLNLRATAATMVHPVCVWCDTEGNLYVSVQQDQQIRKIDTSSIITVVAGIANVNSAAGAASSAMIGDGGQGTSATFVNPQQIYGNSAGLLFIADYGNAKIRMITLSSGIITSAAGTGVGSSGADNGRATSTLIREPMSVWVDTAQNVYFGEYSGFKIRKVDINSIVSTFVGTGVVSPTGSSTSAQLGDGGAATSATIDYSRQIFGDAVNYRLYFAGTINCKIRAVTFGTGIVSLFAGNGNGGNLTIATGAATSIGFRWDPLESTCRHASLSIL